MKTYSKTLFKLLFSIFLVSILFMPSCKKDLLTTQSNHSNKLTATSRTLSSFLGVTLTAHAKIAMSNVSNITISGDSINAHGVDTACIALYNCSNVHITKCKLLNSQAQGVMLYNCTNVLIDSCFVTNVASGVYVHVGSQIRVNYNQFYNMVGPAPGGNFVQFNNVTGTYNRISGNKCEDSPSTSGAGDGLSLYQSTGTSTDPIYVGSNWIRGGGTNTGSSGMAGIVAGDVGGGYQTIDANILVNTGYVGIQQQGGSYVLIQNNEIYSKNLPWSGCGLGSANYSGTPAANNTIKNNKVNWIAGYLGMGRRDTVWKPGSGSNSNARPINWDTNIPNAAIDSTILPTVIITWK